MWSTPIPSRTTQLRVGRLTKAHGLKGGIKLELYTDDPDRRFVPGATFSLQVPDDSPWAGRTIVLDELRWYNGHPVAFFRDVPDRTVAESLIKAILWIDHDESEQTGDDDAWYDHQLVGLRVLRDGVEVGVVARVDHLPAHDLLAVADADREVLVPFVRAIVPTVDVAAGSVTITPPMGLFEDPVDDREAAEPSDGAPAAPSDGAPAEPSDGAVAERRTDTAGDGAGASEPDSADPS
ncbi:ribosome maturation factor RimM [Curtobacterium ammoniigenes]|uniref:ribosome maturation factor RimM n=1 Tax=Curtobacterium ammoniigenes TaxID=395387 RepID=UPI0009F8BCE9|nr:ribosome maturation factor RimM [Curtobacterium ammoniigenes]